MSNDHELIKGRVFIGGAEDVKHIKQDKDIDTVIDLRSDEEIQEETKDHAVHHPIQDDTSNEDEAVKKAVDHIVDKYNEGENIFFHCAAGKNRTGTVAIGTLLELEFFKNIEDAEAKVKSVRPEVEIKPEMKETLKNLYPDKSKK